MVVPEWVVWLTLFVSFLAAIIASLIVSARSIAKGESIRGEWAKEAIYGVGAMLAVWGIYFLIGNAAALL